MDTILFSKLIRGIPKLMTFYVSFTKGWGDPMMWISGCIPLILFLIWYMLSTWFPVIPRMIPSSIRVSAWAFPQNWFKGPLRGLSIGSDWPFHIWLFSHVRRTRLSNGLIDSFGFDSLKTCVHVMQGHGNGFQHTFKF